MERIINLVPKSIFILAKIGLVMAILILAAHYTYIKFALFKVCNQASLDGYISAAALSDELSKTGIADKITVLDLEPEPGVYVEKLGDPLRITVAYTASIPVYGDYHIDLTIPVSHSASNEGYYGEGY